MKIDERIVDAEVAFALLGAGEWHRGRVFNTFLWCDRAISVEITKDREYDLAAVISLYHAEALLAQTTCTARSRMELEHTTLAWGIRMWLTLEANRKGKR